MSCGSVNTFILLIISLRGGGGGGGVHPVFFVKLDFEIAVVQQTNAELFRGFRTPGAHAFIWSIFSSILQNNRNMLKTKVLSKLEKNWLSYEQNTH